MYPFIYKSTNAINWSIVNIPINAILTGILTGLRWDYNKWIIWGSMIYTDMNNNVITVNLLGSNNYDASNIQTIDWDYSSPTTVSRFTNHSNYIYVGLMVAIFTNILVDGFFVLIL